MLMSDIVEVLGVAIEQRIGGEWKHEVNILGYSYRHVNFEVDGKEYVLVLREVKDGYNWSEYLGGTKNDRQAET